MRETRDITTRTHKFLKPKKDMKMGKYSFMYLSIYIYIYVFWAFAKCPAMDFSTRSGMDNKIIYMGPTLLNRVPIIIVK